MQQSINCLELEMVVTPVQMQGNVQGRHQVTIEVWERP
jgi:hypothetical protein